MKNGEAIWNAAKVLGKELSIGLRQECDAIRNAAERAVAEYKEGTLSNTVKEQFEKDKRAAESVLYSQVENLEKEIQKLKAQIEQRKQAEQQAAAEEPDEGAEAFVAEPQDFEEVVEEAAEAAEPTAEEPSGEPAPEESTEQTQE